jgi:hypothetical protein
MAPQPGHASSGRRSALRRYRPVGDHRDAGDRPVGRTALRGRVQRPSPHAVRARPAHRAERRNADPPGVDPRVEQQRGALLNAHGRIYVPYGGLYGDCGDYHGALVSLPPGPSRAVHALELAQASGIWSAAGPAEDPAGDILAASGRGATSPFELQDSVLRLTPALRRVGFFAPSNWSALASADLDVGAGGPAPLAHGQMFPIGKERVVWLLSGGRLGGIGHPLASAHVCASAFGGSAYRAPWRLCPPACWPARRTMPRSIRRPQ